MNSEILTAAIFLVSLPCFKAEAVLKAVDFVEERREGLVESVVDKFVRKGERGIKRSRAG